MKQLLGAVSILERRTLRSCDFKGMKVNYTIPAHAREESRAKMARLVAATSAGFLPVKRGAYEARLRFFAKEKTMRAFIGISSAAGLSASGAGADFMAEILSVQHQQANAQDLAAFKEAVQSGFVKVADAMVEGQAFADAQAAAQANSNLQTNTAVRELAEATVRVNNTLGAAIERSSLATEALLMLTSRLVLGAPGVRIE